MRILVTLLIVLLLALQGMLWFGDNGISKVKQLRETVAEQEAANEALKASNANLRAEVEDLRQGSAAIEERARSELGLIKEGETFYQVIPGQEQPDGDSQ